MLPYYQVPSFLPEAFFSVFPGLSVWILTTHFGSLIQLPCSKINKNLWGNFNSNCRKVTAFTLPANQIFEILNPQSESRFLFRTWLCTGSGQHRIG